ncbi:MAG TPA: hypothetical protein VF717_18795, partial [Pyrinomonadaceae bacterium]
MVPEGASHELRASFLIDLMTSTSSDSKMQRHGVRLFNAVISEPIIVDYAEVPYHVTLSNCLFKETVDLSHSIFQKSLVLDETVFMGAVNFKFVIIKDVLQARKTQFKEPKLVADFDSIKIGNTANFDGATFEGPLNFIASEIGGTFQAEGTHFNSTTGSAQFTSMKIGGNVLIRGANFEGPTRFLGSKIAGIFRLDNSRFNNSNTPPNFNNVKVDVISFDKTIFLGHPEFSGVRYETIGAGPDEALLSLPEKFKFDTEMYANLESFLLKSGKPEAADRLYIAQKWRERKERLDGFSWLGNILLYVLVGYGRRPWLALIYGIFIVLIGYLVFHNKEGMDVQKPDNKPRHYSPFWYSLDLFAPIINLQASSIWIPRQDRKFARNYMHVQRILGWILIPIGIVAWTGLIK